METLIILKINVSLGREFPHFHDVLVLPLVFGSLTSTPDPPLQYPLKVSLCAIVGLLYLLTLTDTLCITSD